MGKRHLHVDILCVLFGIGTWLCVNGLWVEMPLLVQYLPEGWSLPSYIAVIIQLANLGPITYTILNSYFPSYITETRSIYFVMALGLISAILLAQFWMNITMLFGDLHSVALFGLVFFLASVDCSSRVLYLPWMARLKPEYLTSYFIGEGLSGFVPSIFALIQGAGGSPECVNATDGRNGTIPFVPEPAFSIEAFFYLMAFVTLLSAIAFYLLNCPSIISKSLVIEATGKNEGEDVLLRIPKNRFYHSNSTPITPSSKLSEEKTLCDAVSSNVQSGEIVPITDMETARSVSKQSDHVSKKEFGYLMIVLTVICGLANGVFPSLQSFSCLPYGNSAYHWAVTLSIMANPAVCFLMFFIRPPSKSLITFMTAISLLVGTYVLHTAAMSPSPPLVGTVLGQILLISAWILMVGLFTYVKVSVATMMRVMGKNGLFWTGAFSQLGSSFGAITIFFLVNYGNVFQSYSPCG